MTEQKPREYILKKKQKPTIESDYDVLRSYPASELDGDQIAVESLIGLKRVIEKSAYDQALTRIKELEDDYANMVRSDFNRFNAKCESDGKLYRAQELLDVAVKALEVCANRGYCRSYECCANCGPIYEAEEALAKIGQTK